MEVIFSAIMGELLSTSISFLVDKYLKQTAAPTEEKRLHCLRRLLLRAHVIVKEAEDRCITNEAMLHQLATLKKEMYRGYYVVDSFSCRTHGGEEDRTKDDQISQPFASSKFNLAKRVRLYRSSSQSSTQGELLEQVLGSIENTIQDVREFAMFLNGCPPLNRQPYSMYLLLNNCMFNRQMEMEHIMNFLLQADTTPGGAEDLGVLPIIGPGRVGKSTLIEHACLHERVRNHFFQIVCFTGDDLRDASVSALIDRGTIKYCNRAMDGGRTLIIIELLGDIDECVWRRLFSAAKSRIASGSKIIIAGRSDKIARFGTTQALRVQLFTQEAYWYFFKVRLFGSLDVADHPKLAALAMDMARETNGCFVAAGILCEALKANFNPHFWRIALANLRNYVRKNLLLHGARLVDMWQNAESLYLGRVNETSSEYFVSVDHYETGSAQGELEAPMISMQDLLFGSVKLKPEGKFKVLAVRSHLPPYYNYMFNCEIRRPYHMIPNKNSVQKSSSS